MREPGGWFGKWVGERAFGGPLGEVGAPIVLGIVYLASLVLAIGFHPINVLRGGWARTKQYFVGTGEASYGGDGGEPSGWTSSSASSPGRRKSSSGGSRKQPTAVQRRVEEPPAADLPEPRIIDATVPQEKRPSLAEIESGRKKKGESKPSLAGLRLENYQLPPLDLLEPHRRGRPSSGRS